MNAKQQDFKITTCRHTRVPPLLTICFCSKSPSLKVHAKESSTSLDLPSTYQRLIARRVGNSFREVAGIRQFNLVLPKDKQVLVKVKYAGVNGGCETFRVRGEYAFKGNKEKQQIFLGAECVGTVVALGDDVDDLEIGQDVIMNRANGFSEYVIGDSQHCQTIDKCSPEAAALALSGFYACAVLEQLGQIKQGDAVLITAAGGALGSFAVQVAKKYGCHVIGTCGSQKKAQLLNRLKIDRVINYRLEDVQQVLKQEYSQGIDVILDGVGGKLRDDILPHLAPNGKLLCVGYISQYPHVAQLQQQYQSIHSLPNAAQMFWGLNDIQLDQGRVVYGGAMAPISSCKERMLQWYRNGEIIPIIDEKTYIGLDSVCNAVEHMLSGEAVGKVVIKIQ